jgi:hypothetical protein
MKSKDIDAEALLWKQYRINDANKPPLKARRSDSGAESIFHIPLFDIDLLLMQLFFLGIPSLSFFFYGLSDGWNVNVLLFWFSIMLITCYLTLNSLKSEFVLKITPDYLEYTWYYLQPFPKRIYIEEITDIDLNYKKLKSGRNVSGGTRHGGLDSFTISFFNSKNRELGRIGRMMPGVYVAYLYFVLRNIPLTESDKY